jgi:hypothetical protein
LVFSFLHFSFLYTFIGYVPFHFIGCFLSSFFHSFLRFSAISAFIFISSIIF